MIYFSFTLLTYQKLISQHSHSISLPLLFNVANVPNVSPNYFSLKLEPIGRLWHTSGAAQWNQQQQQQRGSDQHSGSSSIWTSSRGRGRVGPASGEPVQFAGASTQSTVGNFRPSSNSLPAETVVVGGQQEPPADWATTTIEGDNDNGKSTTAAINAANKREPKNDNVSPVSPFACPLLAGFLSIFSRRSRRKEFDKASSIQQHLRAIRHAENLDRQTHFRRSQGKLFSAVCSLIITLPSHITLLHYIRHV